MQIRDIFERKIDEEIDPIIKVSERLNERKLAKEIGNYVVTPAIEKFLDDFLEHYTETFLVPTSEIGVWISGYFGSGKSHLAKIASLLIENRSLEGIPVSKRFEGRLPYNSSRRDSIKRSLFRLSQNDTCILAFNINTLADSKTTPLSKLLLSQYYQSRGYSSNFIYARVIEAELDKQGKLVELHSNAEKYSKKTWAQIGKNPAYYNNALCKAACDVVPEIFRTPEEVSKALKNAESGELYNIQFLVNIILDDLREKEIALGKPCRLIFVMDEAGQWIEDDGTRLGQLQALVEEAAVKGQGKVWIFVTTHEDMSSIYQNAGMLKSDMKKIEGRFLNKIGLTTENIELVLEDRIFKKKLAGKDEVAKIYGKNPGVLSDIGVLAKTSQKLPECNEESFVTFYPFFPYQIHLIPEIVKSLRSAGGRGEQMSGSTRTLLAITQDILKSGRRHYLDSSVGEIVSFDEVYNNLAGEAEVNPDVRRDLSQIEITVNDATDLTRKVAEVLYLVRGIKYVPRTLDNISRLLVEHSTDDLSTISNRIQPEIKKLMAAGLVAKIGEEYEFLTPVEKNFEKDVAKERPYKLQDLEMGLSKLEIKQILDFNTVQYKGGDFPVKIFFDERSITREGAIQIQLFSPLSGAKLPDLEERSLGKEEKYTIFILSGKVSAFEENLAYYIAVGNVIGQWKGDPHKSEDAHKMASERESKDLGNLRDKVMEGIREGLKGAKIIFRGASRSLIVPNGQSPIEALVTEISDMYWPTLFPRYIPFKILNEQKAIAEVLNGSRSPSPDVQKLSIYDKTGQIDEQSPLISEIKNYLSLRQSRNERILGADLIEAFTKPPYGWDTGAIRIGVAALIRAGSIVISLNKRPFTNPADQELQSALRRSNDFNKVELALEEARPVPTEEVREILIRLTGNRKIDETPAALSEAMEQFGSDLLSKAEEAIRWSQPACMPLPKGFIESKERVGEILALKNPNHRIGEIFARKDNLERDAVIINSVINFIERSAEPFIEMRDFAGRLRAVEHLLPEDGVGRSFLANWKTALENASITDEENWKALQMSKASASLELERHIGIWKEEARKRAQDALDRLPKELEANGLPADLGNKLSEPLSKLLINLEKEKDIIRISRLPVDASSLAGKLEDTIRSEAEKLIEKPGPNKPIKHLRFTDVTKKTTSRIRNVSEWDKIRDLLDATVKKELNDGKEVELI